MQHIKWVAIGAIAIWGIFANPKVGAMALLVLLGLAIRAIMRVINRKVMVMEYKAFHAGEEQEAEEAAPAGKE